MRSFVKSLMAVAVLAVATAPAAAQVPGIELKLNPRIGLYAPLSDLGEADLGSGPITAEMNSSLAIGLGAELQLAALPFGIRANLDYATSTGVDLSDGVSTLEGDNATLLAFAGDLMFRPLPNLIVFQPYVFVGGGLKQYDFDAEDTTNAFDTTESDPTFHIGGGLDLGFGPASINVELSDYISSFDFAGESELQHDIFITAGFSIGLL
jgi:opacity protein-like surface antigen